ncbi:hypothetical protein [Flavobacterium soli]|uniref:hypothetical protein n=1 Tax=Flavobacterium soli TaxID=344881 RepID=UPI0004275F46|nr:hypothetical protein [Flavobacterium soli]
MEANKNLQDIEYIKNMMNKSTQFISLSGMAGVLAGVYALVGAFYVNFLIESHAYEYITLESTTFRLIVATAFIVLFLSLITAYILTVRKAKKMGEKVWNPSSRRLVMNFAIPLFTGGIFALLLLKNGHYGLISPVVLIFYGLACVNASKYTFRDVRYLGITEIILGLIAIEFSGYGLHFWVVGFGICHIFYGAFMYFKYERNS